MLTAIAQSALQQAKACLDAAAEGLRHIVSKVIAGAQNLFGLAPTDATPIPSIGVLTEAPAGTLRM